MIIEEICNREFVFDVLKKYIRHVENCEGINFISYCNTGDGFGGGFTQDEVDFLKEIAKNIDRE
jgi:hypothetical protein